MRLGDAGYTARLSWRKRIRRGTSQPTSRVLCANMLRASYEVDPDLATLPQIIKPIYALQTEGDCRKSLRSLPRLLRDRMVAARMAYPFLKEAESGKTPALPAGLKRFSLNQMARTQRCRTGRCGERRNPDLAPEPAGHPFGNRRSRLFASGRARSGGARLRTADDQPPGHRICDSQRRMLRDPGGEGQPFADRSGPVD